MLARSARGHFRGANPCIDLHRGRDDGGRARGRFLGRECHADVRRHNCAHAERAVSIAGAIAGFFVSIVLAALFFLLIEIAHNTRNPFNQ